MLYETAIHATVPSLSATNGSREIGAKCTMAQTTCAAAPWGLRDFEALGDRTDEVKRRIHPKLFPGGYLEHYGHVLEVRDVDGDDVDEVLLGRSEMRGMTYVSRMWLVSLEGGRLRVVHDFGVSGVYSSKDELGNDRVIIIPVIYYTPRGDGRTPEFHVDYYRASCWKSEGCGFAPRPSAWQYYKSGSLGEGDYSAPQFVEEFFTLGDAYPLSR
jgi:hypothetical protein